MKQLAGSIRIGWVIEYKGKPWTVVKAMHIKPGKGGAFMQVEMLLIKLFFKMRMLAKQDGHHFQFQMIISGYRKRPSLAVN